MLAFHPCGDDPQGAGGLLAIGIVAAFLFAIRSVDFELGLFPDVRQRLELVPFRLPVSDPRCLGELQALRPLAPKFQTKEHKRKKERRRLTATAPTPIVCEPKCGTSAS